MAAQTTGTLTLFSLSGTSGFTINTSTTLNGNREWEVSYSADIEKQAAAARTLVHDLGLAGMPDQADPPYIFRYGQVSRSTNACSGIPQSTVGGNTGYMPLTAWQQTLRAHPDTRYMLAVYSSKSDGHYYNNPIACTWFQTPADPNPPSTPWAPTPGSTGCFAETSLSLVQSCLNCKYQQTDRRWDANANQCVSASS
ncbi:MAG: hypothetical protein OXE41_01480 [Gammaproteobacteria bacterium]|nr:hypothetical protein [Gammaproteobacteria bacterium]MCY4274062.1 hypothetical protein [Gammaproteobacteria bacterium]